MASSNDPHVSLDRALKFAERWGSLFVNIGGTGQINSASGLADPEFELLREATARAALRELSRA
jgi:predicted alpha/beta hydrolase family esterase